MPYLEKLVEGDAEIRTFVESMHSLKVELPKDITFTRMEWWASSFDDPGEDWNRFKFFEDDSIYPTVDWIERGY